MRIFPKLDNIVVTDGTHQSMSHAVINDGYLVATNAHVMVYTIYTLI